MCIRDRVVIKKAERIGGWISAGRADDLAATTIRSAVAALAGAAQRNATGAVGQADLSAGAGPASDLAAATIGPAPALLADLRAGLGLAALIALADLSARTRTTVQLTAAAVARRAALRALGGAGRRRAALVVGADLSGGAGATVDLRPAAVAGGAALLAQRRAGLGHTGCADVGGAGAPAQLAVGAGPAIELPAAAVGDCLLYTSDAADARSSVDLGGRRIIKKKQQETIQTLSQMYARQTLGPSQREG